MKSLFNAFKYSDSRDKTFWTLVFVCAVFVILRFPSLIEPHWYGDEGVYQVVGHALNEGRMLYKEVWDNKPPLLYLIYSVAQSDLYTVKMYSLIAGFLSVIAFYFLSNRIFKNKKVIIIVTFIFAVLFGSPVLEGNIANAENFMLLPIILAAYSVLLYAKDNKLRFLIIAGLLLSVALVIKVVAFFDFAAFFVFLISTKWFFDGRYQKDQAVFIVSFLTFMIISLVYFTGIGAFYDFINGVFFQNVSYVGEQYGAKFPGLIIILKNAIFVLLVIAIFKNRKRLSQQTLFIYIWTLFSLYNAYFSDRPYIHYLLVLLPAFCLLVGHFLSYRSKTRILDFLIIIGIVFVAYFHFQIYNKALSYYGNFLSFVFGEKSVKEYQSFFDRNTPRDYEIANFIKINTTNEDSVFLMSDSAQIYALSNKLPIGKYTVFYHITYYKDAEKETTYAINKSKPKYVIQTREGPELFKLATPFYRLKYIMGDTRIYERES